MLTQSKKAYMFLHLCRDERPTLGKAVERASLSIPFSCRQKGKDSPGSFYFREMARTHTKKQSMLWDRSLSCNTSDVIEFCMNGSALLKWNKNTFQTSAYKMMFGFLCFFILEHLTVQRNLKNSSQDSYKYTQVTGLQEDKVHQLPQGLLILFSFMQKQRIWDLKLQLQKSSTIKSRKHG